MERLKAWQAWLRELKPQLSDHPLDALVGALDVSESPTGTLLKHFACIFGCSQLSRSYLEETPESPTGTAERTEAPTLGPRL